MVELNTHHTSSFPAAVMFSVRASRWLQSRLTPSPLRSHRLPSKRSPKRLPLKPFSRSLGLTAALVAATGLAPVAVAQPTVAVAERGDLALVPYYTVRGQWVTGIHIVNTSERTQVVKFRFRRATDGMDALDFNVVMSPRDVYAGFLSDDQNGSISWSSPDSTCTAPATQGNRLTMPPIYRVGAESGYVEIIAMGQAQNERQPIAVAAKHDSETSMPLDCAAVRSNFFADGVAAVVADPPDNVAAVTGKRGVLSNNQTYQPGVASASDTTLKTGGTNTYTDSGNVLKVSYFIRDNSTGIEFGDNAVHIADFLGLPSITNQEYGIGSGDLNGFEFPDLDGTGLPGIGTATGANPTIVRDRFNLLRGTDVLGAERIFNEWSANPANGVQMDWVVTLPGQYTMLRLPQYLKSLGTDRAWVPTVGSAGSAMENPQCPRTASGTGESRVAACDFRDLPLELEYVAYNREEFFKGEVATGTLVVSPQPPAVIAKTYLPKVANVITFGGNSVLGQSDANVNASLGQPFGWVEAQLKPRSNSTPHVCEWVPAEDGTASSTRPLGRAAGQALTMDCASAAMGSNAPVIGFAAWSRQVAANPDASYGRVVEHSYRVPAPGMPTGLSATGGTAQVALSWAPVNGASRYTVYYSTSSISDLTAATPVNATGTSATVTGLTNATEYFFKVTASNTGGESPASTQASAVTAPGAPTGLSATGGNTHVTLNWAEVNGASRYTVYYSTSSISDLSARGVSSVSFNATTTTTTVAGLTNATQYFFKVTASNTGGESPASNEASATTAPGAPTGLSATGGNAQVTVSWETVTGATGYTVYFSTSTISDLTASGVRSVSATTASATVPNLTNGTQYFFKVTASNTGGEGSASAEASATTAPGAPTNPSATAGNAQATVSWTAVGGATSYTVYYSTSTISDITTSGVRSVNATTTSHIVTSLTNGTEYFFKVTATNVGGEGAASSEVSATPTLVAGFVVFRDTLSGGGEGPQMVVLPTGSFSMGSPSGETGRDADEGPLRTVTISKRIAMGRYEVTFADYDRFADAQGTPQTRPADEGWGRGSRPVIRVSRVDAEAYAGWLSTQTGKTYRLPSEAEWEYAARAGTATAYSFGASINCNQANYGRQLGGSCNTGSNASLARTVAVGSFPANAFGLFDMHGNATEWVKDCYFNTYTGAPTNGSARTSCGSSTLPILRGGAWVSTSQNLRSAGRFSNSAVTSSFSSTTVGFRLVRDLN